MIYYLGKKQPTKQFEWSGTFNFQNLTESCLVIPPSQLSANTQVPFVFTARARKKQKSKQNQQRFPAFHLIFLRGPGVLVVQKVYR